MFAGRQVWPASGFSLPFRSLPSFLLPLFWLNLLCWFGHGRTPLLHAVIVFHGLSLLPSSAWAPKDFPPAYFLFPWKTGITVLSPQHILMVTFEIPVSTLSIPTYCALFYFNFFFFGLMPTPWHIEICAYVLFLTLLFLFLIFPSYLFYSLLFSIYFFYSFSSFLSFAVEYFLLQHHVLSLTRHNHFSSHQFSFHILGHRSVHMGSFLGQYPNLRPAAACSKADRRRCCGCFFLYPLLIFLLAPSSICLRHLPTNFTHGRALELSSNSNSQIPHFLPM